MILRVVTRLNIGGPARHVLLLSRALPERGYPSELVFGSVTSEEGQFAPDGVAHTHIPSLRRRPDPYSDVRAARAISALIRDRRPAIVHTHMAKAGFLGRRSAFRNGVPATVHTFHGHVLEGYFPRPIEQTFLRLERRLAQRTSVLVAVSTAVRDSLLDMGVGRPEQWRVVPLGLELEDLLQSRQTPADARRQLGLEPDRPTIGIVGRLVPIKDHETFLRAARFVQRVLPDVQVVVAGDGFLRERLEATARDLLGERTRFLGWVEDLPLLYAALDVVVLTSRNEGTPVALIETGAAAKPCIATSVGGVEDVVRDGVTGMVVPPADAGAVAECVLEMLASETKRAAMGAAAREWVGPRFSADRLVTDMVDLYTELLARAGST